MIHNSIPRALAHQTNELNTNTKHISSDVYVDSHSRDEQYSIIQKETIFDN